MAANKGARYLVLIGEDELQKNEVIIRDLSAKKQKQVSYDKESVLREIRLESTATK
jgi:histidyl-tRNA synthetase